MPEHLFALKQALKLYEFYQKQLRDCEAQIERCLRSMADKSQGASLPPSVRQRRRQPEKNEVRFGARALLFRMAGVDLTVLEGISETTALVMLSEIGTDLEPLSAREEFRELAGSVPAASRQCRQDLQTSDAAWRQPCGAGVAHGGAGLSSCQECVGGVLSADSGAGGRRKAVVATARKIAERVYRLLKYGQEYVRQSVEAYETAYRLRQEKALAKKAASLGYKLVPETMPA